MTIDPFWLGIGAAILAAVLTFFMPVSGHRVNQTLIAVIIVVLIFVAAFALLPDFTTALLVAIVVSALAIIYRDVMRFVKHAVYGVTKYTRRDWWYRRVGESLLGTRRGRRR